MPDGLKNRRLMATGDCGAGQLLFFGGGLDHNGASSPFLE
jgi:hypothetical protein